MRSYGDVCAVRGRKAWLAAREFAWNWRSGWIQHLHTKCVRPRLLSVLVFLASIMVSDQLIGQSPAESIHFSGITQEPASSSFTAASSDTASLFQSQAGFEPLTLSRISKSGDLVYLDWQGGIPPYKVQVCDGVDKPWTEVPRVILENFYAGFTSGPYKFYRVRTEPDTNAPSAPGNLALEARRCDRILMSWTSGQDANPGSGLQGHNLYRDGQIVRQISAPDCYVLDIGLSPGRSYEYAVSSVDRAGNESKRSAILTLTTTQCPVSGTNEIGSSPGVTLAWDPSEEPSVAGYIVHWGREPGSSAWQTDVMQATSATITGLMSGEAYFFTVTAYDVDGAESESSHKVACIAP